MILYAVASSLLQLSVIRGIKQNVVTESGLRCFVYCSLTTNCEKVTQTYKSPGKWVCDFKTGKNIWTQRKNVFVESYVQINTDVYKRNTLLEGRVVEDDSSLAEEDGSGRPFGESEDSVVENDSDLAGEEGSGRTSEESEDGTVTTPRPFLDTRARSTATPRPFLDTRARTTATSRPFPDTRARTTATPRPDTRARTTATPRPFLDTRARTTATSRPFRDTRARTTATPRPYYDTRARTTATSRPFLDTRARTTATPRPFLETRARTTATPRPYYGTRARATATATPFLDTRASRKYGLQRDCSDLKKQHPEALSGVYTVNPGNASPFRVYCDLTTASHAWTVIQRRPGGTVKFNRTSAEYKDGFGDLKTGFWLGNEKIRRLTEGTVSQLRFDLKDFNRKRIHAVYTPFTIGDATDGYRIQIGAFAGNAGDSFRDAHGQKFSTEDNDKDGKDFENCAQTYGGGWWYKDCGETSLNGRYNGRDIFWRGWDGASIRTTEMKIRSLEKIKDCSDLKRQQPDALSGVYTVNPGNASPFRVYCDLTTASHAWTVIQRRPGGSVKFNRTSAEYKDGFGDLKTGFWLGNEKIHRLTEGTVSQLRFDLKDFNRKRIHAVYTPFTIADATDGYRIQIGTFFGNAGDSFRDAHGQKFSTEDNDKDGKDFENCAQTYGGGWWYKDCGETSLNGRYNGRDIFWRGWDGASIRTTEMKIRSLEKIKDCVGLSKNNGGSYIVNPDDKGPFPASCDTTTEAGNWMVIQRRTSGSENFYRTWAEYARGFGDTEGEFWIGNNILNRLTKSGHNILRIDIENIYGEKRYAIYQGFEVADRKDGYRLTVGNYSGNAGDSLRYHSGHRFSTKDKDRDSHILVKCARKHTGAWWFNACHKSHLNGQYNTSLKTQGIVWQGLKHPITFTEMKVKQ